MRKSQLLVGAIVLVMSAASYGFVHTIVTSPVRAETVEADAEAEPPVPATSTVSASLPQSIDHLLRSTPDPIVFLVTGAALFGLAEGVRRNS